MKFSIKNRFSGEVQFTAEIKCAKDEFESVKVGLAVRWAIENSANLSGADLSRANLSSVLSRDLAVLHIASGHCGIAPEAHGSAP